MKAIAIEAYDSTGRPAHLFRSFTEAEAAGYVRKSIHRCITGARQTHGGLAWRVAPPEAFAVDFALRHTQDDPAGWIEIREFTERLSQHVGQKAHLQRVLQRLLGAGIAINQVRVGQREFVVGTMHPVFGEALTGRMWTAA